MRPAASANWLLSLARHEPGRASVCANAPVRPPRPRLAHGSPTALASRGRPCHQIRWPRQDKPRQFTLSRPSPQALVKFVCAQRLHLDDRFDRRPGRGHFVTLFGRAHPPQRGSAARSGNGSLRLHVRRICVADLCWIWPMAGPWPAHCRPMAGPWPAHRRPIAAGPLLPAHGSPTRPPSCWRRPWPGWLAHGQQQSHGLKLHNWRTATRRPAMSVKTQSEKAPDKIR